MVDARARIFNALYDAIIHVGPKQPMNKFIVGWGSTAEVDPLGLDLLANMLAYEPATRISAKLSMSHPYFDNLDKMVYEEA